jgi:hypothetical protein
MNETPSIWRDHHLREFAIQALWGGAWCVAVAVGFVWPGGMIGTFRLLGLMVVIAAGVLAWSLRRHRRILANPRPLRSSVANRALAVLDRLGETDVVVSAGERTAWVFTGHKSSGVIEIAQNDTGFLLSDQPMEQNDPLVGIIGHEIAHKRLNHVARHLTVEFALLVVSLSVLAVVALATTSPLVVFLAGVVITVARELTSLAIRRSDEYAADELAAQLVGRDSVQIALTHLLFSGGGPTGDISPVHAAVRTHPPIEKRLARIASNGQHRSSTAVAQPAVA